MRVVHVCVLAAVLVSWNSTALAGGDGATTNAPTREKTGYYKCEFRKTPRQYTANSEPYRTDVYITANSNKDQVQDEIERTIYNVRILRDTLPSCIHDKSQIQAYFDSSIIALGVGTVAAAFFKSTPAAIGGVSIATGAADQYRAYYDPESKGARYIKATAAARCVSSKAEPLLTAQPALIWQAIGDLQLAISQVKASGEASDAATKAIAAANSTMAALNAEAGAYNSAPSVIDQAHDTIKNYIDLTNHRGVSPSAGSVESAITDGIKATAGSASNIQTARSQLVDAMKAQVKATAGTPTVKDATAPVAKDVTSLATANRVNQNNDSKPKAQVEADAAGAAKTVADNKAVNDTLAVEKAQSDAVVAVAAAKSAPASQKKVAAQKVKLANADVAKKAAAAKISADKAKTAGETATAKQAAALSQAVSALIAATDAAQIQMPSPQYTATATAIATCTAGVS